MINIPVKISSLERRRKSIGLLHIVAAFFLVANVGSAYKLLDAKGMWVSAIFLLVALASIFYGALRQKQDPFGKYNQVFRWVQAVSFLVLGIVFLQTGPVIKSLGLFIWFFLSVLLALTEKMALQTATVQFATAGVSFPAAFRQKQFGWEDLEAVTLRPDFLTLHFLKNRYLQFELAQALDETTTKKLQDFCRAHLKQPVAGN